MESTGTKLKNLRLQKGLSLEDVHKKTKIHLNILKAIEEDSLVNFSPVYIKGFLKIYCKSLGVDPRDCISDYKENKAKFTPESDLQ
ncbi:MAG: helix-turn-helix domain-containing protein, partial [Candidatus Omnitrophica bacterium]|nr:helix-turn-helix domain-containing protein [Candidatus Omnitrophota bacterium]